MIKHFTFLLLLLLHLGVCFAQTSFQFDQNINLTREGEFLELAFSGGLNAAQIQTMDVNGDGEEEMVIWDINARQVSVFKVKNGTYTFFPELAYYFPSDVNGFLVLADYDGDGKKDLFTSSPFGVRAYKNVSSIGATFPSWELSQNFLRLDNNSNLQANNLDIPLIMDVDGDGDLDIVTFNFASGDFLEFYRNTSIERKGVADIDGFAFPEARWGGFEFCGCGSFSFGVTCLGFPIGRILDDQNKRIQHAGGHSIVYADFDGDGSFDLLMGQDECDILYYLPNKGTNAAPVFDEFVTSLPDVGKLPEFPIFHAARLWENQLLVSINSSSIAGPFLADYAKNIFSVPLDGGSVEPFLQNKMLDLGENTRPFFQGNKLNGSLLLSANSLIGNRVVGNLNRISVVGQAWEVVEEDYLGLSELNLTDLQFQTFRNAQGQQGFWLAATDTVNFSLVKKLFYTTQSNLQNLQEINISEITPRPLDHFEFFSFENQNYVLLARQTGELILLGVSFLNAQPQLSLLERNFLGFQDNPASRNLTVHVISGHRPSLYAVDQRGSVIYVANFMNSAGREEVLVEIGDVFQPMRLGRNTWISAITDAFGSNYDLILGNTAGGLTYLKSAENTEIVSERAFVVKIFPNPTAGPFRIIANQSARMRLINSLGQVLFEDILIEANREVELQEAPLASGVYILNFSLEKGKQVSRRVIVKP